MVAMGTEPRWVVVGSGSAGRRHVAALRRRDANASITVVRRPESHQPIEALAALDVQLVATVAEAAGGRPAVAIVAGAAPGHGAAVAALLDAGADVLVEKPLASDVDSGKAIVRAAHRSRRSVCVGYHLRADEVVAGFRAGLACIGPVSEFALHVGQHLDGWRPGVEAARTVSARRELGGGVLLELSHEIDAALWCFGPATAVAARLRHDGAPTDGLVETVADLDLEMATGAVGTIHLDMVSVPARRVWRASGPAGSIEADLLAGTVRGSGAAGDVDVSVAAGWRDRAEDHLIDNLFAVHASDESPMCTVNDGVAVLEVIAAARASVRSAGRSVPLEADAPAGGDAR